MGICCGARLCSFPKGCGNFGNFGFAVGQYREGIVCQSEPFPPTWNKSTSVVLIGMFTSISLTQDLGMRLSHWEIRERELSSESVLVIYVLLGSESSAGSRWHRPLQPAIWQVGVFGKRDIPSGCWGVWIAIAELNYNAAGLFSELVEEASVSCRR